MWKKIKQWFTNSSGMNNDTGVEQETFTRAEVRELIEEARAVGYTDGKRDGLTVAREQAANSLREILKQQNRQP